MDRPVRVLQSFKTPRETTNPYIHMLSKSLRQQDHLEVIDFSWRTALVGRYDVFHLHWPEILVSGRRPWTRPIRQLLFLLTLFRARLMRIALVRTQHNLAPPSGISSRERALLMLADRMTTLRITLNAHSLDTGHEQETVVHGHYRDWFARYPRAEPVPGRLAFVGLVRPYKGVDLLVDAFREIQTDAANLQLRIAGRPSSADIRSQLERATRSDPRISLHLEFLNEAQFVEEISSAELIVLPYRDMHNSGAALATLSLDRPVLVPDNAVNRDLALEVGHGWVHLFPGTISADLLTGALKQVRTQPPQELPDLSARGWAEVGAAHLRAYRRALAITRRRPA